MRIDDLVSQLSAGQPWWVYLLAIIIPTCMVLAIREFTCWFWKLSALVKRLDRIEKSILALHEQVLSETNQTEVTQDAPANASSMVTSEVEHDVSESIPTEIEESNDSEVDEPEPEKETESIDESEELVDDQDVDAQEVVEQESKDDEAEEKDSSDKDSDTKKHLH